MLDALGMLFSQGAMRNSVEGVGPGPLLEEYGAERPPRRSEDSRARLAGALRRLADRLDPAVA